MYFNVQNLPIMKQLLFLLLCSTGIIAQECIPVSWAKIDAYDCGDDGIFEIVSGDTSLVTISDMEGLGCGPCTSAAQVQCGDVNTNIAQSFPILLYRYDYLDVTYKIYSEGNLECGNGNNDDLLSLSYTIDGESETIISLCGNNATKTGTVRIDGTSCEFMNLFIQGGTSSKSEFWYMEVSVKGPEIKPDPKPIITDIGTDAFYACEGDQHLFYSEIENCNACSIEWTNVDGEVIGNEEDIWHTFQSNDDNQFHLTVTSEEGCSSTQTFEVQDINDIELIPSQLATVCKTMGVVQDYNLPVNIFDMYLSWEGNHTANNRFDIGHAPAGLHALKYKSVSGNCLLEGTTLIEVLAAAELGVQDTIELCIFEDSYALPNLVARDVDGYWVEVGDPGLAMSGNSVLPFASEPGTYTLQFIPLRTNSQFDCIDATLIVQILSDEEAICATTLSSAHIAISGEVQDGDHHIHWNQELTSTDAIYHLMHSMDGVEYSILSVLKSGKTSNTFIHNNPANGAHYYKIKYIDNLGISTYSEQIVIHATHTSDAVILFPNPVTSALFLDDGGAAIESIMQMGQW